MRLSVTAWANRFRVRTTWKSVAKRRTWRRRVQQVEATLPDLAVVDVTLDGPNGIELIERVKSHHPEIKILVSSMHDESLYAERAVCPARWATSTRRESIRTVIGAIRQVLRGEVYLSPQMVNHFVQHHAAPNSFEEDPVQTLSNREMEVFELIGRGMTTQQIADKLHLSPSTVETHRRNARHKLNLENASQLNRYAFHWVERTQ